MPARHGSPDLVVQQEAAAKRSPLDEKYLGTHLSTPAARRSIRTPPTSQVPQDPGKMPLGPTNAASQG